MDQQGLAMFRPAVEHAIRQGELLPHQAAAFEQAWSDATTAARERFSDLWRTSGSPAAPPPPKPSNPLAGFPWFPQLDNGPEGWRQCQTSSIAMCLAYLRVANIRDDLDYLRVLRRYGDTIEQDSHRRALAELAAPGRFVTNCGPDRVRAEILAGRPVAVGWCHHGPVTAPSGGGHWSVVYGFDAAAHAWIVMDPYGEADLINGGWARSGGDSGRAQRYSWRNFNRRWEVDGPDRGWAWLFGGP